MSETDGRRITPLRYGYRPRRRKRVRARAPRPAPPVVTRPDVVPEDDGGLRATLVDLERRQAAAEEDGIELTAEEIARLPVMADADDVPGWPDDPPDGFSDDAEYATWTSSLPTQIRAIWEAPPYDGEGETGGTGFTHHDRDDGPRGEGFAAGGLHDLMQPGPELAAAFHAAAGGLAGTSLAGLSESALIGVLCASQRLASWAQAGTAAALATLVNRRKAQAVERQAPALAAHLDQETAIALALTGHAASRLLQVSVMLGRLPGVHSALAAGRIDWARACLFADLLAGLPADDSNEIADSVLEDCDGRTTGQLRAALTRAILAYDPGAAQQRRRSARRDTSVEMWHEPSGNAALAGRELDPADAITVDARLSAAARWLKANGAQGPPDQLRAALFITWLAGRPVSTLLPPGVTPAHPAPDSEPTPADPTPNRPSQDHPSQDRCSDNDPHQDAVLSGPTGALTGTINLTMPLTAWLGLTSRPGELAGYGAIDVGTCRRLAAVADSATRWCLTLTTAGGSAIAHACATAPPHAGATVITWAASLRDRLQYLETGTCSHARRSPRYKPPPALRHLIQVRHRTCAAPGCRRSAWHADLDHTLAWHKGGLTCECGLAPLCRRHHRVKQSPGWHVAHEEPGILTWTTPSGRSYITRPGRYPV